MLITHPELLMLPVARAPMAQPEEASIQLYGSVAVEAIAFLCRTSRFLRPIFLPSSSISMKSRDEPV